jgi:hypothetical protein
MAQAEHRELFKMIVDRSFSKFLYIVSLYFAARRAQISVRIP